MQTLERYRERAERDDDEQHHGERPAPDEPGPADAVVEDPAVDVALGSQRGTRAPKALDSISPRIAGSSVSATSTAISTVAAAVMPIAVRNGMRTTESEVSATKR